jgi:hypothetical protein
MVRVQSSDSSHRFPHDLVHFVIEAELLLDWGFWGMVCRGAAFDSVTAIEPARCARRLRLDKDDMKLHNDRIVEAEALVGTIDRLWSEGVVLHAGAMKQAFGNTWHAGQGLPVELEDAQRIFTKLTETKREWDELEIGSALEREWPHVRAKPR